MEDYSKLSNKELPVYANKGKPTRLDYMAIYDDFMKKGMTYPEIMKKHKCSYQSCRLITGIGYFFEKRYTEERKALEEYPAEELMKRLVALGYSGKLIRTEEIDISKI